MAKLTYLNESGVIRSASSDDTADHSFLNDGELVVTTEVPPDFFEVGPQFYKVEDGKVVVADQAGIAARKAKLVDRQRVEDMCAQIQGMTEDAFLSLSDQQRWLLLFNVVKNLVEKNASRSPVVALQSVSTS
jgi:hypothetical protein